MACPGTVEPHLRLVVTKKGQVFVLVYCLILRSLESWRVATATLMVHR